MTKLSQREALYLPFDHMEVVNELLKDISEKKVNDFLSAIILNSKEP